MLGLSGGIDSALTATIAADALGPEAVWGVTMPSRYSSEGSVADSRALAQNLGIRFSEIPIEPPFPGSSRPWPGSSPGPRKGWPRRTCRPGPGASILMALSNKHGGLVLATGNKSEMSVGYSTLYGDMVGGYAVLKDVSKTLVYELARWRNRDGEVIPAATIDKPPVGGVAPRPVGHRQPARPTTCSTGSSRPTWSRTWPSEDIVKRGFDRAVVERVARMVDRNEYKRRQSAPGVKITQKALGRDRRLPITNGFEG